MEMLDDSTLQAMVMAELEWEPSLDAAHIGVTAKSGVVTLNGFVDSYAAKAAAERAAGRVQGVKAIAEEIEVRLPSHQKHADDEIAERAVRILAWDIEVPHERIHVKVEHGVVTLTGDVDYQFQRAAAESNVRRLGGTRGVVNLIRVTPAASPAMDPDVVQQRIENALRRNAEVEASRINVSVAGGKVTLRGEVRTWFERSVAEHAAWGAPGVTEVKDELRVQP
jgi:osmotically-inducible protein OsmY